MNWRRYVGAILASALCIALIFALSATLAQAKSQTQYRAAVSKAFKTWIKDLWPEAKKRGVSKKTFDHAFKGVTLNWRLPELIPPAVPGFKQAPKPIKKSQKKKKRQPEFDVPARYFPTKSLAGTANTGRRHLQKWDKELSQIQKKYGVEPGVVIAIWGRETAFGTYKLRHNAIHALATLGFIGLRKDMFKDELLRALEILEAGHISKDKMASSWAGAMGHTQFMPSDFQNHAVDYNGDGRTDIWSTIPDAFASTANYLKKEGWQMGKGWGYEIVQTGKLDCTQEGVWQGKPISEWIKRGAKRTRGRKFSPSSHTDEGYLLMPAGTYGPAFVVTKNFYVIKQYNYADLYALYVGHISDRMGKNVGFEGKWNKVDRFTRDDIRKLQAALEKEGFYDDKIDGFVGSKSRVAIGKYQKANNLPVTCYPSQRELKALLAKQK